MFVSLGLLLSLSGLTISICEGTSFQRSNQGVTDISVEIPPDGVTTIDMRTNDITLIPNTYFINMSSLGRIFLGGNKISQIQDFSFSGVPTVWHIHLTGNWLSSVTLNMFKGLFLLQNLRLDINFITFIESGAFSDLPALKQLYLRRNLLQTLSASIFDPLNQPVLTDFYIDSNSWFCDTSLCWILEGICSWITFNPGDVMECSSPAQFNGRLFTTISKLDICK